MKISSDNDKVYKGFMRDKKLQEVKLMHELAAKCADMIKKAQKICLLSGAGISTNAGIPDFRGPKGLYRTAGIDNPERIFDISYFHRDPSLFYKFHKEFLKALQQIKPTFAHYFFAQLEEKGKLIGIITQNIDSLHQRAGSKKVYEIHGGVWESYCIKCGKKFNYEESFKKTMKEEIPHCDSCGGVIKPDIVFFGEPVKYLDKCIELARESDLFFVVGSSLVVTPAALIPAECKGTIVIVNKGDFSTAYLPMGRVNLVADEDIDAFFKSIDEHLKHD